MKKTQAEDPGKKGGKKLPIEFFSVLMGSYLKSFAKSPKNPCLFEYQYALTYFETQINQIEGRLEESEANLGSLRTNLDHLNNRNTAKMSKIDEPLSIQCRSMFYFLLSKQFYLKGEYQDSIKKLSFNDRARDKNSHASSFAVLKEEDLARDVVLQNCEQQHPLYFYNNIGVVHLRMKKYALASFYF